MAPNDTRALTNSSLPGQVGARRSLQHVRTGSDFGLVWSGADSLNEQPLRLRIHLYALEIPSSYSSAMSAGGKPHLMQPV